LPVSYLGLAYGAGLAWCYEANQGLDLPRALDLYAFQDTAGVMGRLAYDLGNVYQATGNPWSNGSALFHALQADPETVQAYLQTIPDLDGLAGRLRATLARIDEVMATVPQARLQRSDADLIQREFAWAADMLRHACLRLLWVIGPAQGQNRGLVLAQLAQDAERLINGFGGIWHARNRPGGFADSLARLEAMRSHYQ
jgi:hypothetical protein